MKISILTKLLAIIMVLTLVPLIVLGFLSTNNISGMEDTAVTEVDEMASTAVEDSTVALENLGRQIVENVATSVIKQVGLYLEAHPDATLEDLQNDPVFQSIACQPISEGANAGYTSLTNAITQETVFSFYEEELLINSDETYQLAEGFEATMEQLLSGNDAGIRFTTDEGQSYSYAFIVLPRANTITADGVPFVCVASLTLTEFNAPASALEDTLLTNRNAVTATIADAKSSTQTSMWFTIGITAVIVAVVSVYFARGLTRPIKQLTKIADKVSLGDTSVSVDIKSNDEIGELSESFGRLVVAVKFLSQDDDEG